MHAVLIRFIVFSLYFPYVDRNDPVKRGEENSRELSGRALTELVQGCGLYPALREKEERVRR